MTRKAFYGTQDLFFRELLYRDNWAEDLLLAELHLRGDSCQDGWPAKDVCAAKKDALGVLAGGGVYPLGWLAFVSFVFVLEVAVSRTSLKGTRLTGSGVLPQS